MNKTKARMMAEDMEEEQVSPLAKRLRKMRGTKVDTEGGMGPMRRAVKGATEAMAPGIEAVERMTSRPRRSEEEMSELTREVGRGMKKGGKVKPKKYASGGKVTRGDGVCKKGHTKGKMV